MGRPRHAADGRHRLSRTPSRPRDPGLKNNPRRSTHGPRPGRRSPRRLSFESHLRLHPLGAASVSQDRKRPGRHDWPPGRTPRGSRERAPPARLAPSAGPPGGRGLGKFGGTQRVSGL